MPADCIRAGRSGGNMKSGKSPRSFEGNPMKTSHAQFGKTSLYRRVKGFRAVAIVLAALFMALMLASCGPGGSSAIDSSTGGSDTPTPTPTTNTTFTGTFYDNVGNALASKTGVAYLFSSSY